MQTVLAHTDYDNNSRLIIASMFIMTDFHTTPYRMCGRLTKFMLGYGKKYPTFSVEFFWFYFFVQNSLIVGQKIYISFTNWYFCYEILKLRSSFRLHLHQQHDRKHDADHDPAVFHDDHLRALRVLPGHHRTEKRVVQDGQEIRSPRHLYRYRIDVDTCDFIFWRIRFAVLWIMAIISLSYYIVVLIEDSIGKNYPNADAEVTYGLGFYLVAASGKFLILFFFQLRIFINN